MNEIINETWKFAEAKIINACFELNIFDKISKGENTLEKLSRKNQFNPHILNSILTILVKKNILTTKAGVYKINDAYSNFLISSEKEYIGNIWKVHKYLNENIWNNLTTLILDDSSKENLFSFEDNINWDNILPYLNSLANNTSRTISSYFEEENLNVLDLGCGSATLLSTLLDTHKNWCGVGIDNASVIAISSKKHEQLIKDKRLNLINHDILSYNNNLDKFDLVILSNVLHGYNSEQIIALLSIVTQYLKTNGRVLVNEFLINKEQNDIMQYIYDMQFSMVGNGKSFSIEKLNSLFDSSGFNYTDAIKLHAPYESIIYSKK